MGETAHGLPSSPGPWVVETSGILMGSQSPDSGHPVTLRHWSLRLAVLGQPIIEEGTGTLSPQHL